MANPVKAGDAKPWVCAGDIQYDRQVTEEGMNIPESCATLANPGLLFLPVTGAKPSDKGKPGETRGRKVTGLNPLFCGYDRRTTEMGEPPGKIAPSVEADTQGLCHESMTWVFFLNSTDFS
jgi:hypothetical protein